MNDATIERIRQRIRERLAGRANRVVAQEIGISEAMLRALLAGTTRPGTTTLGKLLLWDEATFTDPVIAFLEDEARS